ncbi:MAG: hypothetical protein QOJ23_814, partial [Actinomycetota bacterium]|nr:hypothetical protein [Actinomycetota bacterium]
MRPNRHHPLDEDSSSRMLQGIVHPDDAPPGYAATAGLLATAAQLPAVNEDAAATTVSAMVEVIRGATPASGPLPRRSLIGKLFAGKAALAAMAAVALTATGAAAATGTLPGPVQGAVAGAVSHIGLNLPDDHGANSTNHDGTTATTGSSTVHGADDPAGHDVHEVGDGQGSGQGVDAPAAHDDNGGTTGTTVGNGTDNRGPGNNSGQGNTAPGANGASPNSGPGNNSGQGNTNPGTSTSGSGTDVPGHSGTD